MTPDRARDAALEPVLYTLAAEKMFPDADVASGRLYYCTSAGGYEERDVPLDKTARASAARVLETIGAAIDATFLPAAPNEGLRVQGKPQEDLEALVNLREMP